MERNLPGGPLIEEVMRTRLEKGEPVAVMHIELAGLHEYNEEYGWAMGDGVIHLLAKTIMDVVTESGEKDDCVGHIRADNFVVVTRSARAPQLAQEIIKRFDAAIPEYYSEEARQRRYIDGMDRRGNPYRQLLAAVKIAIVTNDHRPLEHPLHIQELAREVLNYLKLWPGSSYMVDQRHKWDGG
ncbi:MAG: diguanylate cyclase [Chloroflexi bacterium]|nr:diguanylate cyclase [Chloroflexota bacterium]